jgi:hypothetical protein
MLFSRALAFSFASAALLAALPATADTPPPAVTVVVLPPAAPSLATAPLPVAPLPAAPQAAYPPPAAYPPCGSPGALPGRPCTQYGARAGGYYAPMYEEVRETERQSVAAMAVGIVGMAAGGVLLVAGTFALTSACDNGDCGSSNGLVAGLMVSGVVALVAGIPLTVYGSKKVPLGTATGRAMPPSPLPAWAGAPVGRGWGWQF